MTDAHHNPLRLGISGSSFLYVIPRDVAQAVFVTAQHGIPQKLDDRQNAMMVEFMRDMMRAMASPEVAAMESYHSMVWDRDAVLDVILEHQSVENWSVHAPYGRCFDPSSPEAAMRRSALEACSDAIYTAGRLGAGIVVVHPGAAVDYDVPRRTRFDFAADTLKSVADRAGERGLVAAIEPLPQTEIGNSIAELLELVDRIDRSNVRVNFDVNHVFPPQQMPAMIRQAGELISSVHVSDQDGTERHWLPFEGTLDWAQILTALTEVGYRGPLIYETHIKNALGAEGVVRTIAENYKRLIELAPKSEE